MKLDPRPLAVIAVFVVGASIGYFLPVPPPSEGPPRGGEPTPKLYAHISMDHDYSLTTTATDCSLLDLRASNWIQLVRQLRENPTILVKNPSTLEGCETKYALRVIIAGQPEFLVALSDAE